MPGPVSDDVRAELVCMCLGSRVSADELDRVEARLQGTGRLFHCFQLGQNFKDVFAKWVAIDLLVSPLDRDQAGPILVAIGLRNLVLVG